ncbi:AMP-dependent synthetase/ligase [Cellulomonas marina]|uniref:Acyl-CoA synthetase n=1 Tax=Cellulomonas marina TaxID=988821 RepID=A0A1I0W0F8_9CELL|nr:AMP-dependent synthetase/ligase [Cellulomonas marina]GIG27418.1 long-chain-fatty-acid--CoA ligase [Cellulomonas marina]SFA82195.1 long-chain acyl-CoA synthetase [Cellulomonas marina]
MDESHAPLLVELDRASNLNDLLARRVAGTPGSVLAERGHPDWQPVTARAFADEVLAVARGLVALGVGPGDRVGLMSRTRYEWTLLDFAAWAAGAVPVPLYETSAAEQVAWIVGDAEVGLMVVETPQHAATVERVRDRTPSLRTVLVLDEGAVATLVAAGADVPDEEMARRASLATLDDTATIIYTSGTTGRPKGVPLTHGNFAELSANAVEQLGVVISAPGARTLLFMPLAHVFARFIEVLCVASGAVLGHTADTTDLLRDLGAFHPTFVLAVPRVFEKVYNSSEQKAAAAGRAAIFHRAADTAVAWSRALDTPGGPGLVLRLQHRVLDALVLSKIRRALGGRAQWAISGGAPLGERLGHFYRGCGLTVLEGYGLTETTAPATVNRPERAKIGTVGPAMPGTSLRIAADGEIQVRGVGVFPRYHRNEAATAEAFDDGWFRTGDLGALDEDGYLRITGRKKEIIVTAGGKNVAPTVLEDRLRAHPLISQVVVVGDQRPYIGALVTLDAEGLPGWLATHGRPAMTPAEAATDPEVVAALDAAVAAANEEVSRAESIRRYRVLATDLTIAGGHLTPKLSIRRAEVLKDFAADVDALYDGTPGTSAP